MSTHLTTHILDTTTGLPAAAMPVSLTARGGAEIARGASDADGRLGLGPERLSPGEYELRFDTAGYFHRLGRESFYPSVSVVFAVGDREHYHVPLLLSPFGYSTYRGS